MLKVFRPLVYVKFWDHCQDNAVDVKPVSCEIFGILKKETDLYWVIVSWISNGNLSDHNSDAYCILKSTVVEYRELSHSEEDINESRSKSKDRGSKKRNPGNPRRSRA